MIRPWGPRLRAVFGVFDWPSRAAQNRLANGRSVAVQQRIRHRYRQQRLTPLPRWTAKSHNQYQLGVSDLDLAQRFATSLGLSNRAEHAVTESEAFPLQ